MHVKFPIFICLLATAHLAGQTDPPASWAPTGALAEARQESCAVRLDDGRILVSGGVGVAGPLASAELYLPDDAVWAPAGQMSAVRSRHTCTLLVDGRVLVFGGDPDGSAELYDPVGNAWLPLTGTGQARSGHSATLLRDRRVLIAGGSSPDGALASLEVFNPQDNTIVALDATLTQARDHFSAVLLGDGTVLLIGGSNGDGALISTEVFQPKDNSVAPGPPLGTPRAGHSATLLDDGRIFVAGGSDGSKELDTAELYDPSTGAFAASTAKMRTARRDHIAVRIPGNGAVLLAGGIASGQTLAATELYSPFDGSFTSLGNLTAPRSAIAAVSITAGMILAAGGGNDAGPQAACGVILLPAIQFTKPTYHPNESAQASGSNFQPRTTITFALSLVSGAGVTQIKNRLLTSTVTTPASTSQFVFRTGFPAVPIATALAADAGQTLLLTAQGSDGTFLQVGATVKIPTTLSLNLPIPLYEGFDGTFLAQLSRGFASPPMTGSFSLAVTPAAACLGDGTSNTIQFSETSNAVALSATSGSAFLSKSFQNLPLSPLSVVAFYSGDAANESSTASGCYRAVSKSSGLNLRALPNSVDAGTTISLAADVSVQPASPAHTPNGTVTFQLDGFALGTGQNTPASATTLTASRPFTPLSTGVFNLTAQYAADSFFRGASSVSRPITVGKATPVLSLVNPPATYTCNQQLTWNAQLTFPPAIGLAARTVSLRSTLSDGSVTFLGQTAVDGGLAVSANSPGLATATITVPSVPAGVTGVSAVFVGDLLLKAVNSATRPVSMQPSAATVEISPLPVVMTNPATIIVRVRAQNCGAIPTGNVELLDGSNPVAVVALTRDDTPIIPISPGAAVAQFTVSLPAGAHTFQARYAGDSAYTAASSTAVSVTFQ